MNGTEWTNITQVKYNVPKVKSLSKTMNVS